MFVFWLLQKKCLKLYPNNPKQKRWHGNGSDKHLEATVMSILKQR